MKHIVSLIVLLFFYGSSGAYTRAGRDSLLRTAETTKDMTQKFTAYRNLADIHFEEPAERTYLKLACETARLFETKEVLLNTLLDFTYSYIKTGQPDSADVYTGLIKEEAGDRADSYRFEAGTGAVEQTAGSV